MENTGSNVGKFLEKEKVFIAVCSLLVMAVGGYIGAWNSRIEHTISRVDLIDARLNASDARLTIQEHETATAKERGTDRETRIRELERAVFRERK